LRCENLSRLVSSNTAAGSGIQDEGLATSHSFAGAAAFLPARNRYIRLHHRTRFVPCGRAGGSHRFSSLAASASPRHGAASMGKAVVARPDRASTLPRVIEPDPEALLRALRCAGPAERRPLARAAYFPAMRPKTPREVVAIMTTLELPSLHRTLPTRADSKQARRFEH
jgi:hypothetical protein